MACVSNIGKRKLKIDRRQTVWDLKDNMVAVLLVRLLIKICLFKIINIDHDEAIEMIDSNGVVFFFFW